MGRRDGRRERPPLNAEKLNELALAYVGRFATTRSKLASYLGRKLREHGWSGERPPDVDTLTERFASLGYVDDAAYALSKSRSLTGRGYGSRRVRQALRAAGVEEEDAEPANALAVSEAAEAALKFARRRRLGPFGSCDEPSREQREKGIAAMVRAGHSFDLSRTIVNLEPGCHFDIEMLEKKA